MGESRLLIIGMTERWIVLKGGDPEMMVGGRNFQDRIAGITKSEDNVPYQFSVMKRHGKKQFLIVQNHSSPQSDRRERILHDRNRKAGYLAEKNV